MNLPNLPAGIRSRTVSKINGLTMQFLEAGFERTLNEKATGRILLLHGFPELAFSWRKVMLPLVRPDVFKSVVMMSAPFAGPPSLAFDTADAGLSLD